MAALAIGNLARPGAAGLAAGASVPAPERAPSTTGMAGQVGRDQLKNPADVAGQPLSVVGSTRGSLGVPF
jgi:hypothetical protein